MCVIDHIPTLRMAFLLRHATQQPRGQPCKDVGYFLELGFPHSPTSVPSSIPLCSNLHWKNHRVRFLRGGWC